MNVAAYIAAHIHVSSDRRVVDSQLAEIRRYAAGRDWEVVATYVEVASGTRDGRPEFRRLLADAGSAKFDAVIVPAFDHLGRSVKQLTETLEQINRFGVGFVSVTDGIDTTAPGGEQIFGVMAAVRRFTRALIADRIRSGLRRARALGKPLGRPRAPVRPEQIRALRAEGVSYRAIGHRLHISAALAHRLAQEASPDGR